MIMNTSIPQLPSIPVPLLPKNKRPREEGNPEYEGVQGSQTGSRYPEDMIIDVDEEPNGALPATLETTITNAIKRVLLPFSSEFVKIRQEMSIFRNQIEEMRNPNQTQTVRFNKEFPTIEGARGRQNTRGMVLNNKNRQQSNSNNRWHTPNRTIRDRSRNTQNNSKETGAKTVNKTFAEMVNMSKIKPSFIRNIRINAEGKDELHRISTTLSSDYACQDIGIADINSKSKNFITIKCRTEDDAIKLEDTLKNK